MQLCCSKALTPLPHQDKLNHGFLGLTEEDYSWVTHQLLRVSNTCCPVRDPLRTRPVAPLFSPSHLCCRERFVYQGRIVSALEGGYQIQGKTYSPFAQSVAAHVRALSSGSLEKWDPEGDAKALQRAKDAKTAAAKRSVETLGGDGGAAARYVINQNPHTSRSQ